MLSTPARGGRKSITMEEKEREKETIRKKEKLKPADRFEKRRD